MARTKHIIWDWNGTLLNDAPIAFEVLNEILRKRGLAELPFSTLQTFYCHPIRDMYQRLGFDLDNEPFEILQEEWHRGYCAGVVDCSLHHDSLEALDVIKDSGITQAVLSALPHDVLHEHISQRDIAHYFSHIRGLEDRLARSKVDTGHQLVRELGALRESTVLIGDSSHDVETAHALQIECILVDRGFEDSARLRRHNLPVFGNFLDALKHIEI